MRNITLLLIMILLFSGCRGWKTEKPAIHPNVNMDFQPKIKAQFNPLPIPKNTMVFNGGSIRYPLKKYKIDKAFIVEGQKKYNIYCAACHTRAGEGTKSIVSKNGWIVSNILQDVTANKSDNEIYHIIDNGIRTMPGYGAKMSSKEIWQVVLYVRALQKMTRTTKVEKEYLKGLSK